MNTGLIFVLAIIAVILWQAIVWPKTAHYFVVTRWGGQRTGRIIREKIGLIIPFIESGIWVNQELDEIPFDIKLTSKDNLEIRIAGGIHHYPDHRIIDKDGRNVFVGVSPEVFVKGIVKAVEANIAQIGGKMKGHDFIQHRDKVIEVINAMVRMSKPPHMRHEPGERPTDYEPPYEDPNTLIICGNKDCKFAKGIISVDDLAQFLDTHWSLYFEANRAEKENENDHSRIEFLYGIDVERVVANVVEFSEETREALEEKEQTILRGEAFTEKVKMVKDAATAGISPDHALDSVDATMGHAEKMVISTAGGGKNQPIIVQGIPGLGNSQKESD